MTRAEREAVIRLRRMADALEPTLQRQVHRALLALQDAVRLDRLERAIATRDAFALYDFMGTLPVRLQQAVRTLSRAHAQGGVIGKALLKAAGVNVRFDGANPFAIVEARENAARMVTQVTAETRKAIRTIVSRSFTEGIPPREAAQLIRPLIGLTDAHARAVLARRRDLIASGVSRATAAKDALRYSSKLLKYRSVLIARTEIMTASNAGEIASWREAQRLGLMGRADKLWIVTPDDRLCPKCRPMDGIVVPLDAKFPTPFGRVDGPPMHPNCRCAVGVQPAVAKKRKAA